MSDSSQPASESGKEFLLLSRGRWSPDKSKQEIQTAIDSFYVWYERMLAEGKFKPGSRLTVDSKHVSAAGITDGPFTETKEVIGGYWFIVADSLEAAARIAAENPCVTCGLSLEIRPMDPERATAWMVTSETPK